MQDYIVERSIEEGMYIAETGDTVRGTAKKFNSSKSTVHKDVTELLKGIDYNLYKRVRERLDANLKVRHLRGGNATKLKYKKIKETVR